MHSLPSSTLRNKVLGDVNIIWYVGGFKQKNDFKKKVVDEVICGVAKLFRLFSSSFIIDANRNSSCTFQNSFFISPVTAVYVDAPSGSIRTCFAPRVFFLCGVLGLLGLSLPHSATIRFKIYFCLGQELSLVSFVI